MPINFDLEKLRKENCCNTYFETGLYDCECGEDISLIVAIKCGFTKLYSVEIREDWVERGIRKFEKEINNNRLKIYNDDSNYIEKYLINNNDFNEKTLFFLDAHVDNENIKNYKNKCPLFNEIEAIKKLDRKDHVICIDDVRILIGNRPWGESSYGNINWIESLKNKILEINSDYKFKFLNGHIENDVLIAYI